MVNSTIQSSFSSGEVAPSYRGRVDLAKYHSGTALMRNMFVDVRGGASTRQGTEFIGRAKDSTNPVRVIPFQFSTLQTYVLEFGNLYIRVIKNGGYVLEANEIIIGANNANPIIISVTAHGYSNGDTVFISGMTGMTNLNGQYFLVTAKTTNTFSITDLNGNAINSTGFGTYISGGVVARVYTITTTYVGADLAQLKYTQSADVMTLTHTSYAAADLTRTGDAAWTLNTITFGPQVAFPVIASVVPSSSGLTWYTYQVTTIDATTGEESIASVPVYTTASATMSVTAAANVIVTWAAITGALQYNVYRQREVPGSNDSPGGLYGYVGTSLGVTFTDVNISPDFSRTPPYIQTPFAGGNNPGCCCYFQQRKVFGGALNAPQTFYMTQPGNFKNFDVSLVVTGSDAIIGTLNAEEVNAIQFLVPMTSLIALTVNGAWQITGSGLDSAITPTTIVAKPQAYNGCDMQVIPLKINYDILYVPYLGAGVYDLTYNYIINSYYGEDISVLSSHLFFGYDIVQWTWQEVPLKLVWAVRSDGQLLTMTYYKTQDLYGWSHHDTQGRFLSVCSIPEGRENVVYVVVERYINGQYLQYIERFVSRIFNNDVAQSWCVDAGLTLPWTFPALTLNSSSALILTDPNYFKIGDTVTLTTSGAMWNSGSINYGVRFNGGKVVIDSVTSSTVAVGTVVSDISSNYRSLSGAWSINAPVSSVSGLDYLDGCVVTGLADGGVISPTTVVNGTIAVPYPSTDVIVGLPYTCQLQTLPLDVGTPTVQGKRKKISAVTLRVVETRGLSVGPTFTDMKEIKERSPSTPYSIATPLQNYDERINIPASWQEPGEICIQQNYPLPATICAVVPEIEMGDTY